VAVAVDCNRQHVAKDAAGGRGDPRGVDGFAGLVSAIVRDEAVGLLFFPIAALAVGGAEPLVAYIGAPLTLPDLTSRSPPPATNSSVVLYSGRRCIVARSIDGVSIDQPMPKSPVPDMEL
jgi:hypothetical protein